MKKIILSLLLLVVVGFTATSAFADETVYFDVTFDTDGGLYQHSSALALNNQFEDNKSTKLLFIGDSTGNDGNEWVRLLTNSLAAKNPKHSVTYRTWNDALQAYDVPKDIQEGVFGDAYAYLEDPARITAEDNPSLRLTSDMEITLKVAPNKWETGDNSQVLVSKFGNDGERGYAVTIDKFGILVFWSSDDGTANKTIKSTVRILEAVEAEDGKPLYLRVKYVADNGNDGHTTQFFASKDGITYTKIGTDVINEGVRNIHASTSPLMFGSRGAISDNFEGKFYSAIIKNENDKVVSMMDVSYMNLDDTNSFRDEEGNTYELTSEVVIEKGSQQLTVLNASISGAKFEKFNATLIGKLATKDVHTTFINLGHNEGTKTSLKTELDNLVGLLGDSNDKMNLILSTQNPQAEPQTEIQIAYHKSRNESIAVYAHENKLGLVDAFTKLSEQSEYIHTDGIHPTLLGSEAWVESVFEFLEGTKDNFTHKVEYNKTLVMPGAPVKTGYIFSGWYLDAALKTQITAEDKIIEDTTLYAKWIPASGGGTPVGGGTATSQTLMYLLLAGVAAAGIYFFFTDKGRKSIGLK